MSHRILEELGVLATVDADGLADRSKPFEPVHLGTRDVRIGTLLDLIRDEHGLLPPRTGHLGNWEDIASGRSGPMDFNTAICGQGHGYPLIYGFTRTETASGGDGVYLPGSLVERGRRRPLPLSTWDGARFARRDRHRPLFCPFVQAEVDGVLTPLVEVHWRRMRAIAGYRFGLEASAIVSHGPAVVEMLCLLLEEASGKANQRRAFSDLISHAVGLDGDIARCELRRDGAGYLLNGHRFPSARALAEAALLPFRALTDPGWFFSEIGGLRPLLPVVSHLLTGILSAAFGTHYPDGAARPADPFVTHLHWGARAMAGCPPRRTGYFSERSTLRAMRGISASLVAHRPEVDPLCFVLLPAPVFMLCPSSAQPEDRERLAGLFREVLASAPQAAQEVAVSWLGENRDGLSPYLRGRFRPGKGVPYGGERLERAEPVEPDGFRDLSFRQACGIVAAFEEAAA